MLRRTIVVGILLGVSGCLTSSRSSSTPNPDEYVPDEWHDEPAQGVADPIETTADIEREVTYLPEEEAVQIGDEHRPADDWLAVECPHVAARAVGGLLEDRFGDLDNVVGSAVSSAIEDDQRVVRVKRIIHLTRGGGVISAPDVEFQTLREATPQYVTATVTLDHFEHTCRVPAYVDDVLVQMD